MIRQILTRLRSKTHPEALVALRFGTVGLAGFVVNSVLLWLLTDRVQLYYLVSSVLATEVAILCNFALNHTWTFRVSRDGRSILARLLRFNIVSVGGLVLTVLTLFVLKQFAGLNYLAANVFAVGLTSVWNFIANRRWTWPVVAAPGS